MTSTATNRTDGDRVPESVRAGLTAFGALSYPCAMVGS
jgi:hypothetical protein